jgi:hypothetical protein
MSTTGATDEQIAAAAERLTTIHGRMLQTQYAQQKGQVTRVARALVPPGSLIIGPDDRAAIQDIVIAFQSSVAGRPFSWRGESVARLIALIGDGDG